MGSLSRIVTLALASVMPLRLPPPPAAPLSNTPMLSAASFTLSSVTMKLTSCGVSQLLLLKLNVAPVALVSAVAPLGAHITVASLPLSGAMPARLTLK